MQHGVCSTKDKPGKDLMSNVRSCVLYWLG